MKMSKFLAIFIGILSVFTMFPNSAFAAEKDNNVIDVAFPEAIGLNEVYEDGSYGGISYDWLMEISKYTGWRYNFIAEDAITIIDGVMNGKYDLACGMYYQESMLDYLVYPTYSVGKSYCVILSKIENEDVKSYDLNSLNGKTIAVYKKSTKIDRLISFLETNSLNCQISYYSDYDKFINCLDDPGIDMTLDNDSHITEGRKVVAKFPADPCYIAVNNKRPMIVDQINSAMDEIYSGNPQFAEELYDKYFSDFYMSNLIFTDEELDYIKNSGKIKVSVDADSYPAFYGDTVKKGMVIDALALITKRTGLEFEYVIMKSYHDTLHAVRGGECDIVGAFLGNGEAARKHDLILTRNYGQLNEVVLRNVNSAYPSEDAILAIPTGRYVQGREKIAKILYFDEYKDCLDAINSGDADYTIIPSAHAEYLFTKNYYKNIIMAASPTIAADMSIATVSQKDTVLFTILNKSINNITKAEMKDLMDRNLISLESRKDTLLGLIYSNPIEASITIACIVLFIAIVAASIYGYTVKNKMMKLKLNRAEEINMAKSEFFSRMSHEIRTPMNAIVGFANMTKMSENLSDEAQGNLNAIGDAAKYMLLLVNDILDMSKIEEKKMRIIENPLSLTGLAEELKNMGTALCVEKTIKYTVVMDCNVDSVMGDITRIRQVLINLLSNAVKFTEKGEVTLTIKQVSEDSERVNIFFGVKDTGIGIKEEDRERIFSMFEQVNTNYQSSGGTGLGLSICKNLIELMGARLNLESQFGVGSDFCFILPMRIAEAPVVEAKKEIEDYNFAGVNILIAEDNDINAQIATNILEKAGATVKRVADGEGAVQTFKESDINYFSVILMDIMMPKLDGKLTAEAIRALDREDAKCVSIIAMTANILDEQNFSSPKLFDDYVPKPFDVCQLYAAISKNIFK